MYLQSYDLTRGDHADRFCRDALYIVGVDQNHPKVQRLFEQAWHYGWEGGPEEVLLMFWDLCEAEGL